MLGADDEVGVEGAGRGRIRGRSPVSCCRKPPARSSDGSGSTGSRPWRRRPNAASAEGEKAVSARACSAVGGQVEALRRRPRPRRRCAARPSGWRRAAARAGRPSRPAGRAPARSVRVRDATRRSTAARRPGRRCRACDQLADRVAAVEQPAVGAVDEADRALGGDHALEPRRVRPRVVGGRGRLGVGGTGDVALAVGGRSWRDGSVGRCAAKPPVP